MVWVIRQQEPDVIILSFSGTPSDGHGHHQTSAIIGKEAYEAAGDPSRFPEQLKWVKPWHARRLLRSRFAPLTPPASRGGNTAAATPGRGGNAGGAPGRGGAAAGPGRGPDPFPNQPVISVDTGIFDPVIGRSDREISVISRNEHRSQGQGATIVYGDAENLLSFVEGEQPQKGIFDGIDTSWKRLSGAGDTGELLAKVQREFDDLHPEKSVPGLLQARPAIEKLARQGEPWAQWKLDELDEAIALCAGLRTEAEANAAAFIPGETAKLSLTALNRSSLPITLGGHSPERMEGQWMRR